MEETGSSTWAEDNIASQSEGNTCSSLSGNTIISEQQVGEEDKPARWNLRKRQRRFPGILKFDQEEGEEGEVDFSQFIQRNTISGVGSFSDPPPRYNLRTRPKVVEEEKLHFPRYNLRPNRGIAAQSLPGIVAWSDVDLEAATAAASTTNNNHRSDLYVPMADSAGEPLSFDRIAGMDVYVRKLKEMVVLPLLYPEVLTRLGLTPPRGVLFYGPPGTGKTLMARILADSCTRILQSSGSDKKVSFFLRNGSDCLSKWIGEAERHLRTLFQEAKAKQPSIIFFDELDGLAPDRGSRGNAAPDQSHISLVATLLALMDGLDDRGQVVVIGATNRIDALDPALRRPGRFDREFYFPLPSCEARKDIIGINTKTWSLSDDLLDSLGSKTESWSGADLKGLCTEAALNALHRTHPQIYTQEEKIEVNEFDVLETDFNQAIRSMVPSTQRTVTEKPRKLPFNLEDLFEDQLDGIRTLIGQSIHYHDDEILVWPRLALRIGSSLELVDLEVLVMKAIAPFTTKSPHKAFSVIHDLEELSPDIPSFVIVSEMDQIDSMKTAWNSSVITGQPAVLLILTKSQTVDIQIRTKFSLETISGFLKTKKLTSLLEQELNPFEGDEIEFEQIVEVMIKGVKIP